MQQGIDEFYRLSDYLNYVANENAMAAKAACESIKKSNGTLKKALCPIIRRIESRR